jgi:hypothetical protein
VGDERSSKELFEQLFNSYWEHLYDPATIFSVDFFCSVMLFPYSNVSGGLSQHERESIGEDQTVLRRHKICEKRNHLENGGWCWLFFPPPPFLIQQYSTVYIKYIQIYDDVTDISHPRLHVSFV